MAHRRRFVPVDRLTASANQTHAFPPRLHRTPLPTELESSSTVMAEESPMLATPEAAGPDEVVMRNWE